MSRASRGWRGDGPPNVVILIWSQWEAKRSGQICRLPSSGTVTLEAGEPMRFFEQRPPRPVRAGRTPPEPANIGRPLEGLPDGLAVRIEVDEDAVRVENVGRSGHKMFVDGKSLPSAIIREPGVVLRLEPGLVLLVDRRPHALPAELVGWPPSRPEQFGMPDAVGIVGESPIIWKLRQSLAIHAQLIEHVLLLGESGTGKERVAHALHELQSLPRRRKNFVPVNCAELAEGVFQSELFGHRKGAFNGAISDRDGLLMRADGGTLFLDEFAELSVEQQAVFLRVMEDGKVRPVGGDRARDSSFRAVVATNRDLDALKFDLRSRLTTRIELTPLSARREDIVLLANHILRSLVRRQADAGGAPGVYLRYALDETASRRYFRYSARFVECMLLTSHDGENGNIRALEAMLKRAATEGLMAGDHRAPRLEPPDEAPVGPASAPADGAERAEFVELFHTLEGNCSAVARALDVHPSTALRKAVKYGLKSSST